MRRMLALFTAVILISGVSGCIKEAPPADTETEPGSSETSGDTVRVEDVVPAPSVSQPKSSTAGKASSAQSSSAGQKKPAHKHSYTKRVTPPTCTAKGFTTYTCSCGHKYNADYVNPSHSFSEYVCAKCGAVDKSNAYDYLVSWIKKNGQADGTTIDVDFWDGNIRRGLVYDAQYDYVFAFVSEFLDSDTCFYRSVSLDNFEYFVSFDGSYEVIGYLKPSEFTANSPISYEEYEGDEEAKYEYIEISRKVTCKLLDWLKQFLADENTGVTLADLGFKKY